MGDKISPWMPEQDRIRLAVLGKLIEEMGEATQRAARCITHGITEIDPDTGISNAHELNKELTDVEACIAMCMYEFGYLTDDTRIVRKVKGFQRWHKMIRNGGVE